MFKSTQSLATPPSSPSLYKDSHYNNSNIYHSKEEFINKLPKSKIYANMTSPPISPSSPLTRSPNNNNNNNNNSELPPPLSISTVDQSTALYSGELIYSVPDSRFNRQKKYYCVLTPSSLIRFKSYEKACKSFPSIKSVNNVSNSTTQQQYIQDQKVLVSLEHIIAIYKINISSFQSAIRIQYLNSTEASKPLGSLTLIPTFGPKNNNNNNTDSLIPIWIHALRTAMEPYIPGLISTSSAEQFSAIERTKKHNDRTDSAQCEFTQKVILKTKKANPRASLAFSSPSSSSSNHSIVVTPSSSTPLSADRSSLSSSSSSSSSTTPSSSPSSSPSPSSVEHKEIHIPIIFHLGRSSLYILPAKSYRDDFQRYVLRDRYGLLAIKNITVHDADDTISIDVCTINGPLHRLVIISSVGRLLVCAIHRAIQQLVPHFPRAPYNLICPSLISHRNNNYSMSNTNHQHQHQHQFSSSSVTTMQHNHHLSKSSPISHWLQYLSKPWQQQDIITSDSTIISSDTHYKAIITRFEAILMAHCAAFNLNTQRFKYRIERSYDQQHTSSSSYNNNDHLASITYSITVLPANEINGNFTSYSKFELLVFFRVIRHIDYFESISFKNIRLTSLSNWVITNEDSWSQHDIDCISFPTILARELYLLLTFNNRIKSLNLSGCHFHLPSAIVEPSSPTSLSKSPTYTSLSRTYTLSEVKSIYNQPVTSQSYTDTTTMANCQQCVVQAILLAIQTNSMLNLSTLLLDDHLVHECDVDLLAHLMVSNVYPTKTNPSSRSSSKWMGLINLSLRKTQLSGAFMEDLLLSITQGQMKKKLQRIDLQENNGWISAEVFTEVWKECTALTHLSVPCLFKSDESMGIMKYPKLLNVLDLSGSEFNDAHFEEICSWLTHHANTLKPPTKTQFELCLSLTRCGLHGQHIHHLMHAVSVPHHRRLRFTLKLGNNPFIKQVVHQPWLWSSIAKCGPTSLELQHIKWDSNSLKELFDALVQNKMVEKIDLSYGSSDQHPQGEDNHQEEEDNIYFKSTTNNNINNTNNNNTYDSNHRNNETTTNATTVKKLSIDTPPSTPRIIINDGSSHKEFGLPRKSSEVVPRTSSTFDSSTSHSFANMIIKMSNITEIRMDAVQQNDLYTSSTNIKQFLAHKNKREMPGIGKLLSSTFNILSTMSAPFNHSNLTTLSIKNQGLGDDGILSLCNWCKSCPSLESLHVDGNLITISGFRALLDLVTNNSSIHDLPRPENDFRRELHRLEAQAWQLQESEGELQFMVIHMIGEDSRRAKSLIEARSAAREATMIDRSQLPIVADQLDQKIKSNETLYQQKSKHIPVQAYWPITSQGSSTSPSSSTHHNNSTMTHSLPSPTTLTSTKKRSNSSASSSSIVISKTIPRPLSGYQHTPNSSIYSIPIELLAQACPPPNIPLPPIPTQFTH